MKTIFAASDSVNVKHQEGIKKEKPNLIRLFSFHSKNELQTELNSV